MPGIFKLPMFIPLLFKLNALLFSSSLFTSNGAFSVFPTRKLWVPESDDLLLQFPVNDVSAIMFSCNDTNNS